MQKQRKTLKREARGSLKPQKTTGLEKERCHVLRRPGSPPAPERQGSTGSPAGRTAGCLLLPSSFRRTEPAASPRASNTVITCGGVHGAQWMGLDRQGVFSALAPTTNGSMWVGDCQQRGMQQGHPEGRAGAQAAASVEHLGWTRSTL